MTSSPSSLVGSNTGGKILVVDDEPMNRLLMDDLLSACGFEILLAEEGKTALEIANRETPDAILLDVMMPEMNGFEVCRHLKAEDRTRHIPILMLTALSDRDSRIEGIEAGANDFISKPVDTRDIPLRIRNAVKGKNLFDQLQETLQRQIELEETRDKLLQMIVHDMRSPLLGISGMLELLQMTSGDSLDEDGRSYIESALSETGRLVELVNSKLDISRMESNEMPLALADHDLREVAVGAIQSLGALAKGVDIRINGGGPGNGFAHCDANVISRVIGNLVSNAIKFVPASDGRIEISIGRAPGESHGVQRPVMVSVTDNGVGIPEEEQEEIFELFGQASNSEKHSAPSSGVGLAFCKMAIHSHGGAIGVRSKAGAGTTFWFQLPESQA